MTTETPESQVAITDDDGLPIIDLETFNIMDDEAIAKSANSCEASPS